MDAAELQELAKRTRSTRETGVALVLATGLLSLFLFVPLASPRPTLVPETAALAVSTTPNAFAQIAIDAKAAIVYDLATGETLYTKNADTQLPLASLTKLLTVYAALSELSPTTPVTISADATRVDSPRAFNEGQVFSLADIARLTLTASLNDGAVAIAEATAARQNVSESAMLASAAAALGLSQTYAVNGSGLDISAAVSGGYGSARDLALLAGALVKQAPAIAEATTASSARAISEGGTVFHVKNTDPMVATIPGLLLSKTGYTDLAGGNLAIVFDAGINHPVAVVVLGSSQKARFTDSTALIAASFAHFAGVESL
ncbi:MAG: serine hydrolase [Candidatus Pacebacteria bacterium]|nr:serine hydrolase [Candidatus Paceibacterota bacterium]